MVLLRGGWEIPRSWPFQSRHDGRGGGEGVYGSVSRGRFGSSTPVPILYSFLHDTVTVDEKRMASPLPPLAPQMVSVSPDGGDDRELIVTGASARDGEPEADHPSNVAPVIFRSGFFIVSSPLPFRPCLTRRHYRPTSQPEIHCDEARWRLYSTKHPLHFLPGRQTIQVWRLRLGLITSSNFDE